jgi:hypothetical protein
MGLGGELFALFLAWLFVFFSWLLLPHCIHTHTAFVGPVSGEQRRQRVNAPNL